MIPCDAAQADESILDTGVGVDPQSFLTNLNLYFKSAKAWLSVLQASYICFLLQPHHKNFRKRLVKTPKLYFYDLGLACRLLGIHEPGQICTHPLRGSLFENMVVADALKEISHLGLPASLYYWRNNTGLEIELLLDTGQTLYPMEIKSGQTFASNWLDPMRKWKQLAQGDAGQPFLCFGGEGKGVRSGTMYLPWHDLGSILPGTIQGEEGTGRLTNSDR